MTAPPLDIGSLRLAMPPPITKQGRMPAIAQKPANSNAAPAAPGAATPMMAPYWRSEEHTSELQSLMRTSYAVFCLKQKKTPTSTVLLHESTTIYMPQRRQTTTQTI